MMKLFIRSCPGYFFNGRFLIKYWISEGVLDRDVIMCFTWSKLISSELGKNLFSRLEQIGELYQGLR